MQLFKKIVENLEIRENHEDALYGAVMREVESGLVMRDLWAKALAYGNFDINAARAWYIRERVSRLQKKSKIIFEYQRLLTLEDQLENESKKKISRHSRELAIHNEKIAQLQGKLDRISDRRAIELANISRKKKEARQRINKETEANAEKNYRGKKIDYAAAFGSIVVALILFLVEAHSAATVIFGVFGTIALTSALTRNGAGSLQIKNAEEYIDANSSLDEINNEKEQVLLAINALRERAPPQPVAEQSIDLERKRHLEAQVAPLFELAEL